MQASKSTGVLSKEIIAKSVASYGYLAAVAGSTWYLRAERGRYGVCMATFQ